jgi:hypothetical protein
LPSAPLVQFGRHDPVLAPRRVTAGGFRTPRYDRMAPRVQELRE